MARNGKRSLKDIFSAAARKVAVTVALLGSVAGAGWYQYGTVHEQEVRITAIDRRTVVEEKRAPTPEPTKIYYDSYYDPNDFYCYMNESCSYTYAAPQPPSLAPAVYGYTMHTSVGELRNEDTRLHLKSNSDKIQETLQAGKTYRIKYYGVDFLGLHKNILSATPLSEQEIKARADAEKQARDELAVKNRGAAPATQARDAVKAPDGDEVTFAVAADGHVVTVTVPKSGADMLDVKRVRTVTPAAPAPAPVTPRPPQP